MYKARNCCDVQNFGILVPVVLLLLIQCSMYLPLFVGVLCLVFVLLYKKQETLFKK